MTTSTNGKPMAWTKRDVAEMFQAMVEARHREMGRTIERLRKAKGWTQPDLAHEANVSIGTVSRLENGKNEGRSNTVRQVATALGVKAQDILPAADADEGDLSQLDRIESKLDQLITLLEAEDVERLQQALARARAAAAEADRARRAAQRAAKRRAS